MKYLFFVTILFSIKGFTQTAVIAKVELSKKTVFEDPHLLFKISVTNNSNSQIIVADSNTILLKKERYSENDVGYEILGKKKSKEICSFFADRPLYSPHQKIDPFETKYINAIIPQNCFMKKRKYKIVLFLKILINNEISGVQDYMEIRSDTITFKLNNTLRQ